MRMMQMQHDDVAAADKRCLQLNMANQITVPTCMHLLRGKATNRKQYRVKGLLHCPPLERFPFPRETAMIHLALHAFYAW